MHKVEVKSFPPLLHISDSGAQQQASVAYNRSVDPENKATVPKPSLHVPKPRQEGKKPEIPWSRELEADSGNSTGLRDLNSGVRGLGPNQGK